MKILFILPQIYPFYTGGAEIFHYHLLLNLSENNKVGYIGYDNIEKSGIQFYKIYKIKPWKVFIPFQTIIKLILVRNRYDIVHLNYCQGSWVHWFFYPILKKMLNIKYGLTIHDPSLYEWHNKRIFRLVFNNANFIAAVSERLKDGYSKRCNKNIIYLPPLIPLQSSNINREIFLEKIGYNKTDKLFLFVGSLKDSKRPEVIIDAVNLLDRNWLEFNAVKFLIVGDGEQMKLCANKIKSLNLDDYISLTGRIPQEEISMYYKIATYYIIPSIHEGKSMSLIEAMYNKLPIIASDAPGINDIIYDNKNGVLFEVDNYKELSSKILNLVNDKKLANQISINAYNDYLEQFQYSFMLEKYLSLYKLN